MTAGQEKGDSQEKGDILDILLITKVQCPRPAPIISPSQNRKNRFVRHL